MFDEFLSRLGPGDVLPVVVIAIVFGSLMIVGIVTIVATCIYKIRHDQTAATLKHDMLNRGMSAEEIKTVLEAGSKPGK